MAEGEQAPKVCPTCGNVLEVEVVEFIPIKPLAVTGSDAPGSYALRINTMSP
jgi:hypothetical protein